MDSGALLKRIKVLAIIHTIIGAALLAAGIIIELSDVQILDNNRIFIALSFIPISLFITYLLKYFNVKKHPEKFTEEFDERVIAERDRADGTSMRIIRFLLWMTFLGYTFARSAEVFESFTWWLITILSFAATFLPIILRGNVNKKYKPDNEI